MSLLVDVFHLDRENLVHRSVEVGVACISVVVDLVAPVVVRMAVLRRWSGLPLP